MKLAQIRKHSLSKLKTYERLSNTVRQVTKKMFVIVKVVFLNPERFVPVYRN